MLERIFLLDLICGIIFVLLIIVIMAPGLLEGISVKWLIKMRNGVVVSQLKQIFFCSCLNDCCMTDLSFKGNKSLWSNI